MDSPAGFGICVYGMRLGGEMPGCGCQWKCYHCRPGIGENSCWFSVTNNSLGVAPVKVLRFQQAWSGWRSCCFCPLGFFEKRKTMSTQTRVTIVDYYRCTHLTKFPGTEKLFQRSLRCGFRIFRRKLTLIAFQDGSSSLG